MIKNTGREYVTLTQVQSPSWQQMHRPSDHTQPSGCNTHGLKLGMRGEAIDGIPDRMVLRPHDCRESDKHRTRHIISLQPRIDGTDVRPLPTSANYVTQYHLSTILYFLAISAHLSISSPKLSLYSPSTVRTWLLSRIRSTVTTAFPSVTKISVDG